MRFPDELAVMRRALELAARGEGGVEPNPMVGAVLVDADLNLLGEGWHERFGGPHAEVMALREAGSASRGATLFVTLEPCGHQGKTPPCAEAVLAAGVTRVVAAIADPHPAVAGRGLRRLRDAGVRVETGLLATEARALAAPFLCLVERGRPWVHAKWAMTLDGRIASRTGASQWITNSSSREVVHRLRGRMDAIVVGIGTALADNPLLTPRPAGPRVPLRVVLDTHARLPLESRLVQTVAEAPLLLVTGPGVPETRLHSLRQAGVEVCVCPPASADRGPTPPGVDVRAMLQELGRRQATNVLVEGGGGVLGALHDRSLIDEVHVFVAPRLLGGAGAKSPLLGQGVATPAESLELERWRVQELEGDLYLRARVVRRDHEPAAASSGGSCGGAT